MPKEKIIVHYSCSRGPGGQRRDRKKTGVVLRHLSSGIIIRVDEQASQAQNKKIAFERLRQRLKKLRQRKKKRIPTGIPRAVREKRLKAKKERSEKKQLRSQPNFI